VDWNFNDVTVHSNLGGLGPDAGEAEIRYTRVANVGGVDVDLVITNTTEYSGHSPHRNGLKGQQPIGRINVANPTSVTLLLQLVKSGTKDLVDTSGSYLTFYDLDDVNNVGEKVTFITPVYQYWVTPDSELVKSVEDTSVAFASTAVGSNSDNPTDLDNLTTLQKNRAVSVEYAGRGEYTVTLASVQKGSGTAKGGRNFFFAGKTVLSS